MNYILEGAIVENELLTCRDFCNIYLLESENDKLSDNNKKVGILERIINSIKRFIDGLKKLFQSDTERNIKKVCDNIKCEIPDMDADDAVKHLKKVINPSKKSTITEEELNRAKENEKKLNKCLKTGAVAGAIGLSGATLWGLYQNCRGFKKYAEEEEKRMNKLKSAVASDTSEKGPSKEVKKAVQDYNRFTNPILIMVNNICSKIAKFATSQISKVTVVASTKVTSDIGYKYASKTGQATGAVIGSFVGKESGKHISKAIKNAQKYSIDKEKIKNNKKIAKSFINDSDYDSVRSRIKSEIENI